VEVLLDHWTALRLQGKADGFRGKSLTPIGAGKFVTEIDIVAHSRLVRVENASEFGEFGCSVRSVKRGVVNVELAKVLGTGRSHVPMIAKEPVGTTSD